MQGPADSSDDAGAAIDALGPPPREAYVRPVPPRPCRVIFEGFAASEPPRIEVQAWLARLGALTAPMSAGEVVIAAVDQGRKERRYRVRVELTMPDGPLIVDADHPSNLSHEDIYVAIRNAFRATRRALEMRLPATAPAAPDGLRWL